MHTLLTEHFVFLGRVQAKLFRKQRSTTLRFLELVTRHNAGFLFCFILHTNDFNYDKSIANSSIAI